MLVLVQYLHAHALAIPDKTAVVDTCGRSMTYAQLWQAVGDRALQFRQAPRTATGDYGDSTVVDAKAVVIRTSQSAAFVIDYLAAHLACLAAVPLEADLPEEARGAIIDKIAASDIAAGTADVLFTTGTTGLSKGVMISHRAMIADADNLIGAQGFTGDLTFVVCGPLNHIGSLSKLWPSLMCGATVHILQGVKDMDALFRAVAQAPGKCATFLVPASIRMLLQFARRQLAEAADRFDFIETGAAPMAQADMEQLCRLLPRTRLYNTYASTETGIVCTHDYNAGNRDDCVAGCLGRPMRHSRLRIDDEGRVSCSGDTVMSGYLGDAEATAAVLRDGTVHTSDRGYLDDLGRLRLTGREGDVINIGGYKINPVEVEDAARAYPGVADCVCTTAPHPVIGTALRLIVASDDDAPVDRKALAQHLKGRLESHKVPLVYEQAPAIQRTYNGKLDRKHYRT